MAYRMYGLSIRSRVRWRSTDSTPGLGSRSTASPMPIRWLRHHSNR